MIDNTINFFLPNLIENYQLNYSLKKYIKNNVSQLKIQLNDIFFYGGLPFHSWNGNFNTCVLDLPIIKQQALQHIYDENDPNKIIINLSNINLTEYDFLDRYSTSILEIIDKNNGIVEISNLQLLLFLQKEYPNIRYILSENLFLLSKDMTVLNINTILEKMPFINYIKINNIFSISDLEKIQDKNKCCILLNPRCLDSCPCLKECLYTENDYQYNYSEKSMFYPSRTCHNNSLDSNKTYNIYNSYVKKGFSNFYFSPSIAHKNITDILQFYIHFFFKKEYYDQAFINIMKEVL